MIHGLRSHGSGLFSGAALLLGGLACNASTALTVHNGTAETVRIDGLDGGAKQIPPSETLRFEGITSDLRLRALRPDGSTVEQSELPLAPPGGESVWSVGGTGCFAEGDYSSYYEQAELPAAIEIVGLCTEGQRVYRSKGPIAAGPGQRLPARAGRGAVHALVRIPCEAAQREAVARSWLEMQLPSMEP